MLKENLEAVKNNIAQACKKAGRNVDDVTLIAVSKTKPVEMLREVYDTGIRQFGENKVQEMCDNMLTTKMKKREILLVTYLTLQAVELA